MRVAPGVSVPMRVQGGHAVELAAAVEGSSPDGIQDALADRCHVNQWLLYQSKVQGLLRESCGVNQGTVN